MSIVLGSLRSARYFASRQICESSFYNYTSKLSLHEGWSKEFWRHAPCIVGEIIQGMTQSGICRLLYVEAWQPYSLPQTHHHKPSQILVLLAENGFTSRHKQKLCKSLENSIQAETVQATLDAENSESITAIRCTLRDVPGNNADLLAETLLGLGAQSASVTEFRPHGSEEQKIYDEQKGVRQVWNRCTVTAHFSPDFDVAGPLQVIHSAMDLEGVGTDIATIADSDWLDGICASYQPTCIVGNLWIIPSWSDPIDPDAINIRVEPGLAFGTGEHPTTRLCLKMIHHLGAQYLEGSHILDYGTGSGVLALTALKLGATLAVGVDSDPVAVRAARQNGVLNQFVGRWVTQQCGPGIEDEDPILSNPQGFVLPTEYDLVVANILQGPLVELKTRLSAYVKPGCPLLLSGILDAQVSEIKATYGDAFEEFVVYKEDLWALVVARKKGTAGQNRAIEFSRLPETL